MVMKKFRPKVVNGGYICSYCGAFFTHKIEYGLDSEYDVMLRRYVYVVTPYVYDRCPNCLHVLEYEIQEDLHLNE